MRRIEPFPLCHHSLLDGLHLLGSSQFMRWSLLIVLEDQSMNHHEYFIQSGDFYLRTATNTAYLIVITQMQLHVQAFPQMPRPKFLESPKRTVLGWNTFSLVFGRCLAVVSNFWAPRPRGFEIFCVKLYPLIFRDCTYNKIHSKPLLRIRVNQWFHGSCQFFCTWLGHETRPRLLGEDERMDKPDDSHRVLASQVGRKFPVFWCYPLAHEFMDYCFAVGHCEQDTWNRNTQNIRWQHARLQVGIDICSRMTVFLVSFDFNCFTQLLSNWHPKSVHLVSLFARQCPFIRVPCCLQNMALVGRACPWLGICVAKNAGVEAAKLCMCWSRGPGCCLSGMHRSQGRSKLLNTWG